LTPTVNGSKPYKAFVIFGGDEGQPRSEVSILSWRELRRLQACNVPGTFAPKQGNTGILACDFEALACDF